MRRHIKRKVLSMIPSPLTTNRGNPIGWHIKYDCGHEDLNRAHYGHFFALKGVLDKGYEVTMCCSKCDNPLPATVIGTGYVPFIDKDKREPETLAEMVFHDD